jgi:hypothetical protein
MKSVMKKIKNFFSALHKNERLRKVTRPLIKFFVVFLVMLAIFVVIGVAYVWYMGQNSEYVEKEIDATQSSTIPQIIEPTEQAENVPVSAAVQFLSSPVIPGENTSIDVKTKPGSTCGIVVEYDDIPSTDSGLVKKVADKYGMVNWSWTVEESIPVGKWPVTVTCAKGESSAVVVGNLVVENS